MPDEPKQNTLLARVFLFYFGTTESPSRRRQPCQGFSEDVKPMDRLGDMADLICWLSILFAYYWQYAFYVYYDVLRDNQEQETDARKRGGDP